MLFFNKAPIMDDESLCEVPQRRPRSKAAWVHAFVALSAFVCGVAATMILRPASSAHIARLTMETMQDDEASLKSLGLDFTGMGTMHDDEALLNTLGLDFPGMDLDDSDHRVLQIGSDLISIPEEALRDDEADASASEGEDDWANDEDTIAEEDELDAEEEENENLEYDEELEEGETELEELKYNLTSAADDETSGSRRLHGGMMFMPRCPDLHALTACESLSTLTAESGTPLIIPCDGKCYKVDTTDGSTLTFPDGLDIQGKLYFPSTANVVMRTKFVFVQGLLQIDSPSPSSGNQIKFSLYQDEEVSWVNPEMTGMCGHMGCKLGSKVIAVIGGQLDIKGFDETHSCPAWEKLQAVGDAFPQPFEAATDGDGTPLELELAGECRESPGHTKHLGKYTVYCPLAKTITVRGGTKRALTLTSVEPKESQDFVTPSSRGQDMSLKLRQSCRVSWGHTQWMKKCMLYCPVDKTANIRYGLNRAMTFRSVKPDPEPTFVPPTDSQGKVLELKIKGRCYESPHHTFHMEKFTVRCPLHTTANVRQGTGMSLKITNPATGESLTAKHGVHHWAWGGRNMYFFPDSDFGAKEVSDMFPPDSTMNVEYVYADGGSEMDVVGVRHWAWGGSYTFFEPAGYSMDECLKAADDMNANFPVGYKIDISYRRALPIAAGQQITALKGAHHWAWSGTKLFFFPDVDAGEVNRLFPPGYRIQVGYYDHTHIDEVKVSAEAASCWGVGTELALSSHTRKREDKQVAIVESFNAETGMLKLDRPVETPITVEDNPDFAIEVASMSRPVVFEADDDANDPSIGGHLIVFMTESYQHIEGVEIKNFGQAGRLGRYPLHFHMCGTTSNSVVKKNLVHESNQRAYVIHGSHNVVVEENVAFNTPGHCYFLEAGTETGVVFKKNLGVDITRLDSDATKKLSVQSKRKETDDRAAVFWISNPDNYFIGNVAAGCERHGYWFETRNRARREASFRAFDDNEVHSCHHFAFTTYPPGWRPKAQTNVINNLKVYRNSGWGAFLHVTRNLVFKNGIFADNGNKAVQVNRADNITFDGTVFIGQSQWSEKLVARRWWACRRGIIGVSMLPTRLFDRDFSGTIKGTSLLGAKFYNWDEASTSCENTKPLHFDTKQVFTKAFNAPHTFQDVVIDPPAEKVDACKTEDFGIKNAIIEVASDPSNAFSAAGKPGFLASEKVTTMLPDGSCTGYNKCLQFCEETCLRTVSILTNAAQSEGIKMTIKDTASGKSIEVEGSLRREETQNPWVYKSFTASLPQAPFEVSFHDAAGNLIWPSFAIPVLEAAPTACSPFLTEADLTFQKPESPICTDLARNGHFNNGLDWWMGARTKNTLDTIRGIGSSNALLTTGTKGSLLWRGASVSQWIDASCLEAGDTYDISISYRQIDVTGATVPGCTDNTDCPNLNVRSETFDPLTGKFSAKWAVKVAETDVGSYTNDNSFNTISGQWVVTEEQANAVRVLLALDDAADQLVVDDFMVTKVA